MQHDDTPDAVGIKYAGSLALQYTLYNRLLYLLFLPSLENKIDVMTECPLKRISMLIFVVVTTGLRTHPISCRHDLAQHLQRNIQLKFINDSSKL